MPEKREKTDERVKAFEQFGFHRVGATSSGQIYGRCPFCYKDQHFYLSTETGQWDCKKCQTKGNFASFFKQIGEHCAKLISHDQLQSIWKDRGIKPATFKAWGVGHSGLAYTVPVRTASGTVINVKRWVPGGRSLSTAGSRQGLGFSTEGRVTDTIWVTEGEWDCLALWEGLRLAGEEDTVCFAPGAGILPKASLPLFTQKDVIVAFDNDKAGRKGAAKYFEQLTGIARSVKFVTWPDGSPDGFDVRDFWRQNRVKQFPALLKDLLTDLPPDYEENRTEGSPAFKQAIKWTGEGISHEEAFKRFQKWLQMRSSEPLDVMFGTMLANRLDGDPLWMFLVAPPGGMKSELLLTLGGLPEVVEMTSLTPQSLISGFNIQGGDPSLIPRLHEKVLVIKDFTTILTMNSVGRDEIFGILRDAYDGRCEKPFGNGVVRRYESHFGVLAGVTPAIEQLGNSSTVLGERFVRYRLQSTERTMSGRSKILRALQNLRTNSQMRAELKDTAEAVLGWDHEPFGYPEIPEDMLARIAGLAQWTGTLRGVVGREKYTGILTFKPMAEVGTRLAKQLCKLAYGVSLYRRENVVSEQTYQILTRVAQGTAPDRVEEVVHKLFVNTKKQGDKFSVDQLSEMTSFPKDTVRFMLQDMGLLKIVDSVRGTYCLSRNIYSLMEELNLYTQERQWVTRNEGGPKKSPARIVKPKPKKGK